MPKPIDDLKSVLHTYHTRLHVLKRLGKDFASEIVSNFSTSKWNLAVCLTSHSLRADVFFAAAAAAADSFEECYLSQEFLC